MNKTHPYPSQTPPPGSIGALLRRRSLILGLIMVFALIGFEMFNYSTTEYALADILGEIRFAGVRWATILALAFCGIDFAGIARLFLPEESQGSGRETWFLFGAWLLAASLNAMLTWWGVSIALTNHVISSSTFVDANVLSRAVPIFIAIMVWVTRILLISAFSSSGIRIFAMLEEYDNEPAQQPAPRAAVSPRPIPTQRAPTPSPAARTYAASPRSVTEPRKPPAEPRPAPAPRPAVSSSPRPITPYQRPASPPSRPMPQPAPKPAPRREDDSSSDDNLPPEPEYIPDPSLLMPQPSYHSLTAKSNGNSPQSRKF